MTSLQLDVEGLRATFFEEADEHVESFEKGLLALESRPRDPEIVAQIFRDAHSIKGASGTFGFDAITAFTHALETVLDRVRSDELACEGEVASALFASVDVMRGLLAQARTGGPAPSNADAVRERLERCSCEARSGDPSSAGKSEALPGSSERRVDVRFEPKTEFMSRGMDPIMVVRDLRACGTVIELELDISRLPSLERIDPESCYLGFRVALRTTSSDRELRDVFSFVDDLCDYEIVASAAPAAPERPKGPALAAVPATLRVATQKVDQLLDLLGELVIAQAMVLDAVQTDTTDGRARLVDALAAMQRHTRELQDRVMSIRMVPLGAVFGRFPRMVHDLAGAEGKRVRLLLEGEATEIDKSMVEHLVDPMTHLVRNAIDHGLESPQERIAADKPAEGVIEIRAFHEGGNVVIEVADDGRGLDTEAIRAKAERVGLLAPGADVDPEAVHALIMHPGFSTAATVSDISGRGVGLDVVKRNVEALNGSLALTTVRGKGTRFRLRLPLTLAILDGLAVNVGSRTFVLPLSSVVETFRPKPGQVRRVAGSFEVADVRAAYVPVVRMHEVFGVDDAAHDPTRALICIVETNGAHAALLLDDVIGQGQFVVKSLEVNFGRVDALMGATILGDGRVAMIVDVGAVARVAAPGARGATQEVA